MKLSVIIACYNDQDWLNRTIDSLYQGHDNNSFEVIVVDDSSFKPITCREPVKVLRNNLNRGVGYCFDRGVKESVGDVLMLMGSDVLLRDRSWHTDALRYATEHPNSIGCAVVSCFSPECQDWGHPDMKKTYGATVKMIGEDTMEVYPGFDVYHQDVFVTSSYKSFPGDTVPCLIGACYVTTKSWYMHIHGWDTDGGVNAGHKHWGGLEPWISFKTWLSGGEIRVIQPIEAGHIYGRITKPGAAHAKRGVRGDLKWYNKLFIAHTILTADERQPLIHLIEQNFRKNEAADLNYEKAKKMIKHVSSWIGTVRERNIRNFENRSLSLLLEQFDINLPWKG